tara:strand:+ start:1307 stop:1552 length:246 start_codon:yes stop_codon:yes gene_type:complete
MGRKPGPAKVSKMFRLTPNTDLKIDDILKYWQASRSFYNMKTYTRSDVLEQAISQYYKQQKAKHETDGKYCGICGNPTRRD